MKAVTHTPKPLPPEVQEQIIDRVTEMLACAGIHEGSHLSPEVQKAINTMLLALNAGRVVMFTPGKPGHFEVMYWEVVS